MIKENAMKKLIYLMMLSVSMNSFAQQLPSIPQNNGFAPTAVEFGGKYQTAVFTLWYNTELSNTPKLTFKQTLPDGELYIRIEGHESVILTGVSSVTVPLHGNNYPHYIDVFVAGGKKFSHLEISTDEVKAKRPKFEFDVPSAKKTWSTANLFIAKEDCGVLDCDQYR